MLFLIEYDRRRGRLVKFQSFDESAKQNARNARLALEIDLNRRGINHEVVLLDAVNEEAVRRTHRRYFEDLVQLVGALPG